MIGFDADPSHTVRSASYWQQWLFGKIGHTANHCHTDADTPPRTAHYRGTQSLPITNSEGDYNPLFWGATLDEGKNCVYLKIINILGDSVPLTVNIPQPYKSVNGTILTAADLNSYNYIYNQTEVVPKPLSIPASASTPASYGGAAKFQWD
ncbi:hypothetical protein LTR33_018769, partial [Friedmanniomyces endolithicus]